MTVYRKLNKMYLTISCDIIRVSVCGTALSYDEKVLRPFCQKYIITVRCPHTTSILFASLNNSTRLTVSS